MGSKAAAARMTHDEDITAEATALAAFAGAGGAGRRVVSEDATGGVVVAAAVPEAIPLNWRPRQGGHRPNEATRRLLREAGGLEGIAQFTTLFYETAFQDPVLQRFIRDTREPHAQRFAAWITEKFGVGEPWTAERATRKVCPFQSHGHTLNTPHDRSSAHFAAWHSPKREPERFGRHFKLDECRVWLRLHFWALRESGLLAHAPSFAAYYVKFIAHFVSVYERSAPQFARESLRWSSDPANIERYLARGRRMEDGVENVGPPAAVRQLPAAERAENTEWPYV